MRPATKKLLATITLILIAPAIYFFSSGSQILGAVCAICAALGIFTLPFVPLRPAGKASVSHPPEDSHSSAISPKPPACDTIWSKLLSVLNSLVSALPALVVIWIIVGLIVIIITAPESRKREEDWKLAMPIFLQEFPNFLEAHPKNANSDPGNGMEMPHANAQFVAICYSGKDTKTALSSSPYYITRSSELKTPDDVKTVAFVIEQRFDVLLDKRTGTPVRSDYAWTVRLFDRSTKLPIATREFPRRSQSFITDPRDLLRSELVEWIRKLAKDHHD